MALLLQNGVKPVPRKAEEKSINRRKGNHHPNLWSDDFIQSLSSPYGASSYRERVQTLIEEVKNIFNCLLEGAETNFSPELQLLWVVDIVERFGIDRYFRKEIKAALEKIYIYWNENVSKNVTGDLNTTALAFRILRQNGYDVSADVFQIFKDGNGKFFFLGSSHQEAHLRSMLNLYRASELSFQGEKILKDAEMFARQYLEEARDESQKLSKKSQLLHEVDYVLKYPWKCRVPRWEARSSIEICSLDDSWTMVNEGHKMSGNVFLELAILDFNSLQAQHQSELKLISIWWNKSKVKSLDFFRHRHVEYFFWFVSGLFEPEFSTSRIGAPRLSTLLTLLDDIYDTYGTIDELKLFTMALIKWDKITTGSLLEYMKISFKFIQETLEEIAIEAEMKQGARVRKYMQNYWESYILSYLKEAEWISKDHIPTFDEYLKNGVTSIAVPMVTMHPLILMDTFLPEDILDKINNIETLVSSCARLLDDSTNFQDEKFHGENASCIECYVKDNPGSKREDALNHISTLIDNTVEELKQEILIQKGIPTCCKKLYFDTLLRGLFFIFKDADGITFSHNEIKNPIIKIFVEPKKITLITISYKDMFLWLTWKRDEHIHLFLLDYYNCSLILSLS